MAAWGLPRIAAGLGCPKALTAVLAAAVIAAMGAAARVQVGYWRNSQTLFGRAIAVTEDNYLAHFALARPLYEQGRTAESLFHSGEAIRIRPNHSAAHYGHGLGLLKAGRPNEAAGYFAKAAELAPKWAAPPDSLAKLHAAAGRFSEAVKFAEKAEQVAAAGGHEALAADINSRLAIYRLQSQRGGVTR
jgi:tetratricopeptide (TPR) repeat protein